MNNIVESYLMSKVNNICEYINVLAEEMRKVSKVPKQLNKLVYKYYDLFILSDKKIDIELLKNKTGLDDSYERLGLFYLLIEFDMASKTEYKDNEYYDFYNFLINSILIFKSLEDDITNKKTYDDKISKILKNYIDLIDDDYILIVDRVRDALNKKYLHNHKNEVKLNELYNNHNFMINYIKVKHSNNLYFSRFKYRNDKLNSESKKDVELVNKEFLVDLNLIGIQISLMRVLKDTMNNLRRVIFIKLEDELIIKKSNLGILLEMIRLRFLRERIILVVNISLLDKYEERINSLILDGFTLGYYRDVKLDSYDLLKSGGYLVVDYDDLEEAKEFSKKFNLEIIADKVLKEDSANLNNIKYLVR